MSSIRSRGSPRSILQVLLTFALVMTISAVTSHAASATPGNPIFNQFLGADPGGPPMATVDGANTETYSIESIGTTSTQIDVDIGAVPLHHVRIPSPAPGVGIERSWSAATAFPLSSPTNPNARAYTSMIRSRPARSSPNTG